MKALIDTNVVLDVALQRQPHVEISAAVMLLAQAKRFDGYVSASAVSDIYYVMRKTIGHSASIAFLKRLFTKCKIAEVNQSSLRRRYLPVSKISRTRFRIQRRQQTQ